MDASYWIDIWERQDVKFHQEAFNPLLIDHFAALGLEKDAHVFVPLCGKSLDMVWLLQNGFRVTGADLSEIAVRQFFEENGLTPDVTRHGDLVRYAGDNAVLFAGDIFALDAETVGPVDGVFDRAALVALPAPLRLAYGAHLSVLTGMAPQLLLTFEYDQTQMDGPPFSLDAGRVRAAHAPRYDQTELARRQVPGKLKGTVLADEVAWHLTPTA